MDKELNGGNEPDQKSEGQKQRAEQEHLAEQQKHGEKATGQSADNGHDRTAPSKEGGERASEASADASADAKQQKQTPAGDEKSPTDSGTETREETHVTVQDEKKEHEQRERQLQQSLLETELKVIKLENELRQLNEQYMAKVTEKAIEAQKLVNKRLAELQDEFEKKSQEARKYALRSGGAKLAEVLQQFDMVLTTSQKAGEAVKGYAQGFAMVFELMAKTLVDLGITEIPVKPGDAFDHDTMEIFEGVDTKDFQHNQVVEVMKKGYRLHDLVIAHAIVRVAN